MKRIVPVAVLAALALAACQPEDTPTTPPTVDPTETPTPTEEEEPLTSSVGVQLFQFPWESVGEQCTDVLGPAGYDWVLVSPATEHIVAPEWWASYQVVSYKIESRLGTREQFDEMVTTCHEAGVRVIADAVINHMTGLDEGVGWAGSPFTHMEYPGIYGEADFHDCGLTPNNDIGNYHDAEEVQTCELSNLADLDTSSEYVQGVIRAYLTDLVTLGVDGFRIDAAKHMAPEDIKEILIGLPSQAWVIQEVIQASGEAVQPDQYYDNGSVFEFRYMRDIPGIVAGSSWNQFLRMGTGSQYAPPELAVPFVTNHDTERNGQSMTYRDGAEYQLATTLMILQGYGSPMVYSGYSFSDRDAGAPTAEDGTVLPATCIEGWEPAADGEFVCAHTWPMVRAAVRFDAVAGEEPLTEVFSERDVIGLERGDGLAVVNRGEAPVTVDVPTELPDGEYCDLASECATTVVVEEGIATKVPVASMSAVILTAKDPVIP